MKYRKNGKEAYASLFRFPFGFWRIRITYDDKSIWWLPVTLCTGECATVLMEAYMHGETLDI
jgi:hypothetical protein